MRIDFPRATDIQPSEASYAYKTLLDEAIQCIVSQGRSSISRIKYLAIFIAAVVVFYLMQSKLTEFSYNYLVGIVFSGVGALVAMLPRMYEDSKYDRIILLCIKEGKRLEEIYPEIVQSEYFHVFDHTYSYNMKLFVRYLPIGLIALVTFIAGIFLTIPTNIWWAIGVSIFSVLIGILVIYSKAPILTKE